MIRRSPHAVSKRIIRKALALGASVAGTAPIDAIRSSPSHRNAGGVVWPSVARSAVILALHHPLKKPELDWWDNRPGKTPGNRELVRIVAALCQWLAARLGVTPIAVPYGIEEGGIYLKDAAVKAGLGVIGRNNLLVTPRFGPRVRLRALLVDAELTASGPLAFAPCRGCPAPCLQACPRNAFGSGRYERPLCRHQLEKDENNPYRIMDISSMTYSIVCIKYCRACELACTVGA